MITYSSMFHAGWIVLVLINFILQIVYFYNDKNPLLFRAKKITTPLLLFSGLLIIICNTGPNILMNPGTSSFLSATLLLAMGIGELGIEGSSIVQDNEKETEKTPLIVLASGILFLLVNIYLGSFLLFRNSSLTVLAPAGIIAVLLIVLTLWATFILFNTPKKTRSSMMIYGGGLAVLYGGAIADSITGITGPGIAAALLSLSDTLVLIRMGSGFKKNTSTGFSVLLCFLVTILIIYYIYMALLIHMAVPFPL